MAPLPKSSRGRQAIDKAVRKINRKFQRAPEPIRATIVGRNLVSYGGRQFSADVSGSVGDVVTLYNVGTASNARYSSTPSGTASARRSSSGSATFGASGTSGGSTGGAHALSDRTIHLGQLDPDQASWAFLTDGRRSITGNVTMAASKTIDGMDPSAHIANTDSANWTHHEPAESGDGIVVSDTGQVISINRAAQSGLELTTEDSHSKLRLAVGFGLQFQPSGNAVQVEAYSNAVSNPGKVVKTDAEAGVQLGYVTTPLLDTDSGNMVMQPAAHLDISPVGDVLLKNELTISTKNWFSGFGNPGWGITPEVADFQKIVADEAHFQAVIFDVVRAQAGESLLTKSLALISRNFTAPASVGSTATLYVHDLPGLNNIQVFEDDDWVRLSVIQYGASGDEFIVANIWGQVDNYTNLPDGEQSWTFTLRQGSPGQVAYAGGVAIDYGEPGDGIIRNTVLDPAGSPYFEISTWNGANPYNANNRTVHLRLGNLDGVPGLGDEFGLFAGNIYGEEAAPERHIIFSDSRFEAHGLKLALFDSAGYETVVADPDIPAITLGAPPVDLTSGPTGQSGIYLGRAGGDYYDLFAGDYDAGQYIHWDASAGTMTIRGTLLLPSGDAPGSGVTPRGDWSSSSVSYAVNDLVNYGGGSYLCNTAHTSTAGSGATGTPDQSAYWNIYSQQGATGATGTSFRTRGEWASLTTYVNNSEYIDIVSYFGTVYYCTTTHESNSSGADGPPGTGTKWLQLAPSGADGPPGEQGEQGAGYRPRGTWVASRSYVKDTVTIDTVLYGGSTYYCLSSHVSSNSGTNGPPGIGTRWNLLAAQGEQGTPGQNNQDFSFINESGGAPSGYTGLYITSTRMGYVNNGSYRTYMDQSGNFYFGGSTGNHLFWNQSTGRLGGSNAAGVTEWYASSTDGKMYAGGGGVTLEQTGLTVGAGDVVLSHTGIEVAAQSGAGSTGGFFKYYSSSPRTQMARMAFVYSPSIIKEWLFTHNNGSGIFRFENGAIVCAQSVTAAQGMVSTGTSLLDGYQAKMPAGTNASAFEALYNGEERAQIRARGNHNDIYLPEATLGNNQPGSGIFLGRNLSSGSAGNAPAFIGLMRANGSYGYIWFDNAGRLRYGSQRPTGSTSSATVNSETAGTIA